MEKRHINRKRHLAAAVAAMTLAGLNYNANASLTYELTADGSTPGSGKSIAVSSLAPITLDVWATVTGTDGSSLNDALQSIDLSFTSTGGTLGNITSAGPSSPFTANGSHTGAQMGTSGDFDLGSTDVTNAAGWWIGRSGSPTAGTVANAQFKVGTITFTPTTLTTGATTIQATLRNYPDAANGVLWFEDGTTTAGTGTSPPVIWTNDKNTSTGTVVQGTAVTLNVTGGGPITSEWIHTSDSNWNASGNWSGGVPGLAGDTANFLATGDASGTRTVTLDANETVGTVNFSPAGAGYTISTATGKSLTLDTVSGGAAINVTAGSNTISTAVALAKNTTVTTAGGTTLTMSGNQTASAGVTLTKAGTGTLVMKSVHTSGLAVSAGTLRVAANGGDPGTSGINGTLTVSPGAVLDLVDNDLVVNYTGTSPIASIRTGVLNYLNGGDSAGIGQIKSNDSSGGFGTTLALFENSDAGFVTYGGINVGAQTVIGKYTFFGDANVDGMVTSDDYAVVDGGLGASNPTWIQGDLNLDGVVTPDDYAVIDGALGAGSGGALGQPFGGVAAVPEPASIGLMGLAAAGLFGRRRRNR